jgi:hypothetical protein
MHVEREINLPSIRIAKVACAHSLHAYDQEGLRLCQSPGSFLLRVNASRAEVERRHRFAILDEAKTRGRHVHDVGTAALPRGHYARFAKHDGAQHGTHNSRRLHRQAAQ